MTQPGSPRSAPVADLTLILDSADDGPVPGRFRTTARPLPQPPANTPFAPPAPDSAGLADLRASGSAQPSPAALAQVVAGLAEKVVVIDLREETHLFLDNRPVSLFGWRNWGNRGRKADAIVREEARLARAWTGPGALEAVTPLSKGDDGYIRNARTERLFFADARSQAEVLARLGLTGVRLPVTDHCPPRPRTVDAFLALLARLPQDAWLHMHCHAGEGRTTTFLALYDMVRNARTVAFADIVARQALLGGADLTRTDAQPAWKAPFYRRRAALVRQFYDYARAEDPARTSFSAYLARTRPARSGAFPTPAQP